MNKNERYGNGKIYKLVNNVDDEIYIGSTCLPLAKRKSVHKGLSKVHVNRRVYAHLNPIGWDNIDIVLIEAYPCDSKMELEKQERYYIETLKPSLNKVVPTRTNAEYYQDNKDKIQQFSKEYQRVNRKKLTEQQREYRQANIEKITAYQEDYFEKNKEKIRLQQREYHRRKRAEKRKAVEHTE